MVAILLAALTFLGAEQDELRGRNITLYYDDKGANLDPWIQRMLEEVQRMWIASMPYAANVYAGHTAVGCTVARDGSVVALETIVRSGVPAFDNNAEGAIRGTHWQPFPSDYLAETFEIVLVFWVLERPYDIFDGGGNPDLTYHRVGLSSAPKRSKSTATSNLKVDADLSGRDLTVKKNTIIYDEPTGTSQRVARPPCVRVVVACPRRRSAL